MFVSSVLDSAAIDEKQVASFFSKLTLQKLLYAAVLLVLCAVLIRLILKAADKLFRIRSLTTPFSASCARNGQGSSDSLRRHACGGTLGIDTKLLCWRF